MAQEQVDVEGYMKLAILAANLVTLDRYCQSKYRLKKIISRDRIILVAQPYVSNLSDPDPCGSLLPISKEVNALMTQHDLLRLSLLGSTAWRRGDGPSQLVIRRICLLGGRVTTRV